MISPAQTSVSLFASATVLPRSRARIVGTIATCPELATTTMSTDGCVAAAMSPSPPSSTDRLLFPRAGVRFENRGDLGVITRDLVEKSLGCHPSRKGDDAESVQMLIDDTQRLTADRASRAKHGDSKTTIAAPGSH